MSWFARSIANSLGLDDDEDDTTQTDPNILVTDNQPNPDYDPQSASPSNSDSSPSSASHTPRGVKEDLSELSKTLTRQFWGVASFLAPPPPPDLPNDGQQSENENSDEVKISGIRNDFAEIGGKFRTGISNLSSNIAVSEITKIASNLLQFGSEEDSLDKYEVGKVIGLTEEVLAFARDIAMHPETWLDFPFPDDVDFDDLNMSDVQQEHALSVEQVAPRLAALRMEICPGYMSENCFWKIYFVLVHPRLSKHDAELLSTPQILEAREMLSYKLQKGTEANAEEENRSESPSDSDKSVDLQSVEPRSIPSGLLHSPSASALSKTSDLPPSTVTVDFETEKYPVQTTEMQIVDKSVIEEDRGFQTKPQYSTSGTSRVVDEKSDDEVDDWLKEENSDIVGTGETSVPLGNDEDVSFSDLEEEDDGDVPVSYKKVTSGSDSSVKDSRDWVQVGRSSTDSVKDISSIGESRRVSGQVSARNSETKDSSDWLDVDDIDVM